MIDKPNNPLRQRMIEDTTSRRFRSVAPERQPFGFEL
jgi:hypothetical protein